jgi:hypothetical protein
MTSNPLSRTATAEFAMLVAMKRHSVNDLERTAAAGTR